MNMGAGFMFLLFLMALILAMLSMFGQVFCWRAVGHWATRNATEWKNESDEAAVSAQIDEAMQQDPSYSGGAY